MGRLTALAVPPAAPRPADILELLKPVTWFPPIWAFLCGVVSTGADFGARWPFVVAGVLLTGPLVCGTSQAVNDWFDRHVDAINEPGRPIPSGRIPGRWGLWIACAGTTASLLLGAVVGFWVFIATIAGLALAWGYSAPPFRWKRSGWWGPGAVALSYEGLTWFTGAAVMAGGLPQPPVLAILLLYALGAHGIMTLNDFKAVEGDRQMGIGSLPARLGVRPAALFACIVMALPQILVVTLLLDWGRPLAAAGVGAVLLGQFALMPRLLGDPNRFAPWYNATGTGLYVTGMMIAAVGLRALSGGVAG